MRAHFEQGRRHGQARYLLSGAALLLAASVVATAGVAAMPPQKDSRPPTSDDDLARVGEETLMKVCTECHPFDEIVVARRTPRDWSDVVRQMATKGAAATQEQFGTIGGYLTRFYGVVLVNSAPAADLAAVLGIPAEQAEAIVTYRAQHGRFPDLPALLRVPGIDKDKIEGDLSALRFD